MNREEHPPRPPTGPPAIRGRGSLVNAQIESIVRTLRRAYGPATVLFETDDPDAAGWHEILNQVPETWGTEPFTSHSMRTPTGWLGRFFGEWPGKPRGLPDPLIEWCETGRARLEAAGYSGTLRAPRATGINGITKGENGLIGLSHAWRPDIDAVRRGDSWQVRETDTDVLISYLCDVHDRTGDATLTVSGPIKAQTIVLDDNLETDVRQRLHHTFQGGMVSYFGTDPLRQRISSFRRRGTSSVSDLYLAGPDEHYEFDYEPILNWARRLLCEPAAYVNHGTVGAPIDLQGAIEYVNSTPAAEQVDADLVATMTGKRFWMFDEWIVAANPLQLVTERHLERLAGRLQDWTVTPIGHDRYLLEADDAIDWYTNPSMARYLRTHAQFEPALLTHARANACRRDRFAEWGIDRRT